MKKKKIVVMGGGTGTYAVLSGLKKYPVDLTAIVSMADDGGSTGILREEFGILPTGDIRRALVALSSHPDTFLADLFTYRFQEGGVKGHSFGNLILTALERVTGGFEEAVAAAARLLNVNGNVIPVTLSHIRLYAELENGEIIKGESNIDIPKHDGTLRIERVWLNPKARANPRAVREILDADMIVMGPGDLYTSILPNLLISGIRNAFLKSKAKKVYITNLMTKYGETSKYSGADFLSVLDVYTEPYAFDIFLVNTARSSTRILKRYRREHAEWIQYANLYTPDNEKKLVILKKNLLRKGNFVRHDPKKMAAALIQLVT
jgi:uncharacterized cofD-like protein